MSGDDLPGINEPELEAEIRRLITGDSVKIIEVADVSDCQLYGKRNVRPLTGELAKEAEAAGFVPEVYESVYWLTLAYFPVKPLGVFLVMPRRLSEDSDDEDQYRAVRLPDDWRWYRRHYLNGLFVLAFVLVIMAAVFGSMFARR